MFIWHAVHKSITVQPLYGLVDLVVLTALVHIPFLWNEAVATLCVGLVHCVLECKDPRPESVLSILCTKTRTFFFDL
jgi:hypothetical protein